MPEYEDRVSPRVDVLLVTSGLGPRLGGIGCVSQSVLDTLRDNWRAEVVTASPDRSRIARRINLWASMLASRTHRPRLVLYDHIGLSRIHPWVPWPHGTRYAILLYGFEVWRALPPSQRRIIERASMLLAISQTAVDQARRHNPWLPRVRVMHLGVAQPQGPRAVSPAAPLLVLVSRVDANDPSKSHEEILNAWPTIRAAVPSARFVAIGGGSDLERFRRRVRVERLAGVEFLGFLTDAERDTWLRQATAAFALGREEGFGLANVEAAAMGIPLIGLPNTVLDELFPKNAGVRFVRSLRPEDIAETAIELLRDPKKAAELGERGRAHALDHYTQEHFRDRFLSNIGLVLQQQPQRLEQQPKRGVTA